MMPRISRDLAGLGAAAAQWFAERVAHAAPPVRVALSGGETPRAMFAKLAAPPFATTIPWARVHFFWGDERFVPPDHPASNYRMARETLFAHIKIPPANLHPMPTDTSAADAAARYEALLQHWYGAAEFDPTRALFDVVFLGLGADGHTASLLPGQEVLRERRRWVAVVAEGRPETRVTLTYPALESARDVAFLVAGAAKAAMVRRVREGAIDVPAARLKPLGPITWFLDAAAAS